MANFDEDEDEDSEEIVKPKAKVAAPKKPQPSAPVTKRQTAVFEDSDEESSDEEMAIKNVMKRSTQKMALPPKEPAKPAMKKESMKKKATVRFMESDDNEDS